MFEKNQRGKVRCRSIAADAQSLSFQLFRPGRTGAAEDGGVIKTLDSRNQHEVEARQVGLYDLTDTHERGISCGQSLDRQLSSSKKDRFHIQSIFREETFVFSNPNMALPKAEGRITHSDLLEFLGNSKNGGGEKDK